MNTNDFVERVLLEDDSKAYVTGIHRPIRSVGLSIYVGNTLIVDLGFSPEDAIRVADLLKAAAEAVTE